jgi:hypothetical protein
VRVRGVRLQSISVTIHLEEEPDEPEEPEAPDGPDGAAQPRVLPTVSLPSREWEFSTRVLTIAQLIDGSTLVELLKEAATEGWELADVIDGGDKRVLLLRRPKRSSREVRRVGFAPPSQS